MDGRLVHRKGKVNGLKGSQSGHSVDGLDVSLVKRFSHTSSPPNICTSIELSRTYCSANRWTRVAWIALKHT